MGPKYYVFIPLIRSFGKSFNARVCGVYWYFTRLKNESSAKRITLYAAKCRIIIISRARISASEKLNMDYTNLSEPP